MNSLHVVFDIPSHPAIQAGLTAETVGEEAKKMLALFLYEHRRISLGKACELGGMSYWEFVERNRELGITIPYSKKDLEADLKRLDNV